MLKTDMHPKSTGLSQQITEPAHFKAVTLVPYQQKISVSVTGFIATAQFVFLV